MEIDQLKLLRGRPIRVNDYITLNQPRIGEIEECGEQKFMNTFWLICSSAWDMPSAFADMGIDFMTVSDWEYFIQTIQNMPTDVIGMIFSEINFSKMKPCVKTDEDGTQEIVLANTEIMTLNGVTYNAGEVMITELDYKTFIPYVREMIGFQHQGKKAKNRATAKILIQDDRKSRERNKNKPYESMLLNAIISLVNTEEFAYTYESVFDITIFQLMKSLFQIQGKKQACALLQGSMSGFMDTKSIPSKSFQWMYSSDKFNTNTGKTLKSQLAPGGGKLNIQ